MHRIRQSWGPGFTGPQRLAILVSLVIGRISSAWSAVVGGFGVATRTVSGAFRARVEARPSALDLLRTLCTHRHLPLLLALLVVILGIPSLWSGWGLGDDALHRSILLSSGLPRALTDLYVFLDPASNLTAMDRGLLPWWTLSDVRVAFFRPLAAFTHWIDYQISPDSAFLAHAQSVLWYGALCAVAALAYRRFMRSTLSAGLAALLFALSAAHLNCAATLSYRNALQTALFGFLALGFHDRWRREDWRVGAWIAPLCFGIALLSAEAGLAMAVYLVAYALCLDHGAWWRRLCALIPYGAIAAAWLVVYRRLGYGAWGSDFYVDPLLEPLRFGAALLERGPVLLFGQWGVPDPVVYTALSTTAKGVFWVLAVLVLALVAAALAPLVRSSRVARFWCLGMLLAVVPACAVSPASGRHLIFVSVGAIGLMGQSIAGAFERHDWLPQRRAWRSAASVLAPLLLALQAVVFPVLVFASGVVTNPLSRAMTDLGRLPGAEGRDVIVVNAPSPGQFIYLSSLRDLRGQPMPAHARILAPAHTCVELTRIDERTVVVSPAGGYLPSPGTRAADEGGSPAPYHLAYACQIGDRFFRSGAFPIALAQQIELSGMNVEVIALTEDGRPQEARVRFDWPLEDPALQWLRWDWESKAYLPFAPPAVGESVRLSGPF